MNRTTLSPGVATRRWLPRLVSVTVALFAVHFVPDARAQENDSDDPAVENELAPEEPSLEEAEALRLEGDYEDAIEEYRRVLADSPNDVAAQQGLARALSELGRDDEAGEFLQHSKELESTGSLRRELGRVRLRRGRLREAEAEFRKAIALDANDVIAVNRLGETLHKQGRISSAERAWGQVIDIYQRLSVEEAEKLPAVAFVEMGLACVGLNRFRDANDVMFAQAAEKDRESPDLLLAEGRIFLAKYNYPDSRKSLRELLDINRRSADALTVLADNYLTDFQEGTGRYELAEKFVGRALEVNPHHAEAHIVRGLLQLSDGYTDRARADFSRATELDPSSLRARGLLAACYYLVGDDEAFASLEKETLDRNPRAGEFYHALAVAIERKFRYADVVKFCEKAVEVAPKYWPVYLPLAVNLMRVGDDKRGREFLDKAWEHDPYNVWAINTRKLVQHMKRRHRVFETDRFVFRFPKEPREFNVLSTYLVPLLEKGFDKLSARYELELEPPIYVESFAEHKWFSARTVGLEGFAAAGACFGDVVTLTTPTALPQQNWGAVAWHEFAHVVTLNLTHNRVPRWLTEGLSVYEEGRDHPEWTRNFARDVADAFGSDRLLPIAELDFGFSKPKYPGQILMSYFQGCLIVRYIEKTWGFDRILKILRGYRDLKPLAQNFREALDVSLEEFDAGFFKYVAEWVDANGYTPALAEDVIPRLELETETEPDELSKWIDLAWAYFLNGGPEEEDSAIALHRVIEVDPDHGDAHALLGMIAQRNEDEERARENYEKALERGTRFRFRLHFALGAMAAERGDTDAAIEHFEAAKKISPAAGAATFPPGGENTYYRLAKLYHGAGRGEDAVRQMIELRPHAPEDPRCRVAIFKFYENDTSEEAAKEKLAALRELIYIAPYDGAVHTALAEVASRAGDHDTVIREQTYLLRFPSTNPQLAHVALAEAYLAKGDRENAAVHARKVLDLDPGDRAAKRVLEAAQTGTTE